MLDGLGIETGISLDALVDTAGWIGGGSLTRRPPKGGPGGAGQARQGLPLNHHPTTAADERRASTKAFS